jgi:hypothetical protein
LIPILIGHCVAPIDDDLAREYEELTTENTEETQRSQRKNKG